MERITRVELATFSMATRRSTTELNPHIKHFKELKTNLCKSDIKVTQKRSQSYSKVLSGAPLRTLEKYRFIILF